MGFSVNSDVKDWQISQIICIILDSLSIISGIILLILVFTKILPHRSKKNISIRIPTLMTLYFYCTAWMLIIAIPVTSSLFCFTAHHYIAALSLTISIIPLIISHISRVALLRIRHGISNATMAFNLGEISWNQYLDKFEIILQEDYSITNPVSLRKYTLYICIILVAISVVIILFTHDPFFYIWTNCIWLGIVCIFSALIVWTKSDYFNISNIGKKFKLDSYSILKEMHYLTIAFILQFICYVIVSVTYPLYIMHNTQCTSTITTNIVLCIGLSCIWMLQLRYSLRALVSVHRAATLTQILSSYDGYKAFLRFLVSELSIENLEYFQLSMRWRHRICCHQYGIENGTKEPQKHIKLPFKIFSFEFVDRLLPKEKGGGLVPNVQELKDGATPANDKVFFATLPMSRKASFNNRFNYVSPFASNANSRTTTPRFGGSGEILPPPTAAITRHLPSTIVEGNNEEEMTNTATATYMLHRGASCDEDTLRLNDTDTYPVMLPKKQSVSTQNDTTTPLSNDSNVTVEQLKKGVASRNPTPPLVASVSDLHTKLALNALTITAPMPPSEDIPCEDEMIDGMATAANQTSDSAAYSPPNDSTSITKPVSQTHLNATNSNKDMDKEVVLIMPEKEMPTPRTPEPAASKPPPDITLQALDDNDKEDDDEAGMEYIDYHKYDSPRLKTKDSEDPEDVMAAVVKIIPKKGQRLVRFASKVDKMQYIEDTTPDLSPKQSPLKSGAFNIAMNDLLDGNSSSKPIHLDNKQLSYSLKSLPMSRDDSVASKAAEPSWFAAWFRKTDRDDGQEERADTMLHYSDLSWRRLKKVSKEVNMSAVARRNVDELWKKYPRSRFLETKGITLEEYDEQMCASWVSCWENMQDSLRRFAKSVHYERYLQSVGKLTIKKLADSDQDLLRKDRKDLKKDNKKFPLIIRAFATKKNSEHTRAAAVVIR
eukprot:588555_1